MEIKLDFDTEKLQRGFYDIEKANSIAVKESLNTMAGLTRKNSIANVEKDFTLRNSFTKRNILFDTTEETKISKMRTMAGATDKIPYMEFQESGGTRKRDDGHKLDIPTRSARIGGSNKKSVTKPRRLGKIASKNKRVNGPYKKNFKSQRAKNVAAAAVAFKKRKIIKRSTGFFNVTSFSKSDSGKISYRANMLYKKEQSTKVKATPWLMPATEKPIRDAQNIYNSKIDKLLKKDLI